MIWQLADWELSFEQPVAAGIVNVTADSMFEGARSGTPEQAVKDGLALVEAGFDMLDVGAVAAKSGPPVPAEVESAALVPAMLVGIALLIEPINVIDMPGYFLTLPDQARRIIERVAHPNLHLQLDLYHCQIMRGDLARQIEDPLPLVRHIQIAGNPGRHEPDVGEINYPYLFDLIDNLGYRGWIGCEYKPVGATPAGLGWARAYLQPKAASRA